MIKERPNNSERISEKDCPTMDEVRSRPDSENINFDKYRTGDFDHYLGHLIKELIYKDKLWLIYLDENYDVHWAGNFEKLPSGADKVLNRACAIEQMPAKHLSQEQLESAHRYVGEAIARVLQGNNPNEANAILDEADLWIRKRNEELSRYWQLKGYITTAAIAIVAGVLLLMFRSQVEQWIGVTTVEILLGGVAGCFGAFLSLASRTGTLKLDPSAGEKLHIIEGVVRVIAGGGSAVFVATAIKANLLLGAINSFPIQFQLLIAFCIVAGFSERFVPNIVNKFESQVIQEEKKS